MDTYYKIYKDFLTAIERDSPHGISSKIKKGDTKNIKNALLKFFLTLEKTVTLPKLKYSDISPFVLIDPKFLFPHQKVNIVLDNYGAQLEIKTKGLLFQIFKSLDLVEHFNLIKKLYKTLLNLQASLSINNISEIEKYKNQALKLLRRLKELLNRSTFN